MSKRSNRRVAVVATAALALGAIAPSAVALTVGTGAGAGAGAVVVLDPETLLSDDLDLLGLPEVDDVLLGTGLFGAFAIDRIFDSVDLASGNLDNVVAAADLGDVLPECVAVIGCSFGSDLSIPVNVGGINILSAGDDVVNADVLAPVVVGVGNILNGGGPLGGGLGSLLNVNALALVAASL